MKKKIRCQHFIPDIESDFWYNFFTDSLAEELIACGIITNYEKLDNCIWDDDIDKSQVFNFDETPQFINYGVDAKQSGCAYAAGGGSCKKMI